ncbi:MAG: hypothetical protein WCP22_11830 [Chlamydiota bacterium]
MSLADVYAYHTPIVIIDMTNGGFVTANPGGYATPLSPMENPEEVDDEKGTDWARGKVPGTSHPRYSFVAGDPRILRMKLEFHWSADPTAVARIIRQLQTLQYPTRLGTVLLRPPPQVMIVFGLLYIGIKVVITNVKVKYHKLFEPFTLYPLRATVELVMEEFVEESCNRVSLLTGVSAL